MNTIVVIEEDEVTRHSVGALLASGNFQAILAGEAEHGPEQICLRGPCLVVISSPLAGASGSDLRRRIDTLGGRTAITFLSSSSEPPEETLLLEEAASRREAKQFCKCEIIARSRDCPSPPAPLNGKHIHFGDIEIDVERRYIRRSGKTVEMTPGEYSLLLFFVRNVDRALTRDVILNEVWGYDCYPNTRTVDAHVVRLRRKLEPDPRVPCYLLTIHGVGYRFVMFPESSAPPEYHSRPWRVIAPNRVGAAQI